MSKLNFARPNNHLYLEKFCKNTGASDWPPQPGAEVYVHNRLIGLIGKELKDIIKPQLDKMGSQVPSHVIMNSISTIIGADTNFGKEPAEHFNTVSTMVFNKIEQEILPLLGQADPSNWAWVDDTV